MQAIDLDNLTSTMTAALAGSVVETVGMSVAVADFPTPIGAVVEVDRDAGPSAEGEVVGFRDGLTLVYLLAATTGIRRGNPRAARANQPLIASRAGAVGTDHRCPRARASTAGRNRS